MQLVVFAMVLILPALQREGFLSGTELHDSCIDIIERVGNISCELEASGNLKDIDPLSCTLECSGNGRPKLPRGVCSDGFLNCTRFGREDLRNWEQKLNSILHNVLKRWCPYYLKK
uniref:Putative ixodes 10 kDa peptide protein n=1 Tax=Ixodes ricinus TaxID=34613 RepID=A0A0K8RCS5_IXORI